jgi:hypothetical protein
LNEPLCREASDGNGNGFKQRINAQHDNPVASLKAKAPAQLLFLSLNMTKTQIQSEIQKVLDNVPETVLQDVLDFLKELQDQPADKVRLTFLLRKILAEDKDLLERLAQ